MIAYLFGGVKNHDKGLLRATTLFDNTMKELGMGIKEINLGPPTPLPIYDGVPSNQAAEIIANIRAASGVVFATTAGASGLSSVLHMFLEHLAQEPQVLQDKNCMILIMSEGEPAGMVDGLARLISSLGGYPSVQMVLDQAFFDRGADQDIAEKQIEDFYRMVKAKRKFYRPLPLGAPSLSPAQGQAPGFTHEPMAPVVQSYQPLTATAVVSDDNPYITNHADLIQAGNSQGYGTPQGILPVDYAQQPDNRTSAILQNYENLNSQAAGGGGTIYTPSQPMANQATQGGSRAATLYGQTTAPTQPTLPFNTHQQNDVEEISNFFTRKLQPSQPAPTAPNLSQQGGVDQGAIWQPSNQAMSQPQQFAPILNPSLPNSPANQWFANEAANQPKNPRQLTASLVHHYQPHAAGNLQCLLQVEISGPNGFYGYLNIDGRNCDYADGRVDNPSLTVISDETNWVQVITGQMSAQKAFMTGNLKIKGNFVLLTRFDQIFNTSKNY